MKHPITKLRGLVPHSLRLSCIIALVVLTSLATKSQAQTLIHDDFNRGSVTLPEDLNGSAPTTSSLGSITWLSQNWETNGSAATDTSSSARNAFLPFNPSTGNIYTLTATISMETTDSNWIGIGFSNGAATDTQLYGAPNNSQGILFRGDGQVRYVGTNGTAGDGLSGNPLSSGLGKTVSISVILDTTEENWVMSYAINGTPVTGTYTFNVNPTINYIGFGSYTNATGFVEDITLTTNIPESSTTTLILAGAVLGLMLIRKSRKAFPTSRVC
ncbi:hypothetical protein H5P28_00070 [Ruficoccus amylovorans]|uniref:PEP-CTERM protein-sorting domain-containing protein n=1 Tax=Ruficoccus amylovorans TaxID=1804625 RepID=A0A842HA95_9BACT|nr:hypothetical protein [Ruficoccus amylovorans]MBC2592646.1 hypothetical protein [Ruficoccus amylovorans]